MFSLSLINIKLFENYKQTSRFLIICEPNRSANPFSSECHYVIAKRQTKLKYKPFSRALYDRLYLIALQNRLLHSPHDPIIRYFRDWGAISIID